MTVAPTPFPAGPEAAAAATIVGFVGLLREHGFRLGLAESADAVKIAADLAGRGPEALKAGLKVLTCSNRADWEAFDPLFDRHFRCGRARAAGTTRSDLSGGARRPAESETAQGSTPGRPDRVERRRDGESEETLGTARQRSNAARAESLANRDLRHIADRAEMAEAFALAARLARVLRMRVTRRHRTDPRGRRLDLRRTLHAAIGRGGEPIDLVRRRRKAKPPRLVLLLDASGSMELYTPFFLRFMHGVIGAFRGAEAFLFHTRLVDVGSAMRDRDPVRAVDRLSLMCRGIGGGTRIGESLAEFNRFHARRVVKPRSCAIVFSDGLDTGAPGVLGREMRRLARRCRRVVWLNPLLGWRDYRPEARGMAEALPHVDLFAPAHSLASLAALEPMLARL